MMTNPGKQPAAIQHAFCTDTKRYIKRQAAGKLQADGTGRLQAVRCQQDSGS